MSKKVLAIICGGCSVEHEISLISTGSVIGNVDLERFELFPIIISKNGIWHRLDLESLLSTGEFNYDSDFQLLPSPGLSSRPKFMEIGDKKLNSVYEVDVAFPILHGTYGEDGTVQGLFELMDLPYVGASVLGSAIGMDKIVMKNLLRNAGLPVLDFISFNKEDWVRDKKNIRDNLIDRIGVPCFVKSANLGSSVGISKLTNLENLDKAVEDSCRYSERIIVEKALVDAREIEVSVLGDEQPTASLPGEIIPKREFYDYESKYHDEDTQLIIPATLDSEVVEQLKKLAIKSFSELSCYGMGRVDFLMDSETNEPFISELNTIPGFTSISMYPKLWEVSGISYSELISRLIDLAFLRHERKNDIKIDYLE